MREIRSEVVASDAMRAHAAQRIASALHAARVARPVRRASASLGMRVWARTLSVLLGL